MADDKDPRVEKSVSSIVFVTPAEGKNQGRLWKKWSGQGQQKSADLYRVLELNKYPKVAVTKPFFLPYVLTIG